MREALIALLQVNLAAAAAIALVMLLRQPVRTAFGARTAYGLWLLVPMAMLASLAPPRSAEILPAPPIAPASLIEAAEAGAADLLAWGGAETAAPGAMDPAPAMLAVWAIGLALTFGWLAFRQNQFLMLLRQGAAGPAVIGFLKPRIVTPADFAERFDAREQAVVLAHEKVHLARHDARINALTALARCICWFNPLVHLGAVAMRIDQELACDAVVIGRYPKARAPYAQALVKAQLAARPLPVGCYWPSRAEHPLTERIAMLKRTNPSKLRRRLGGALIAVLAAGAGYAAWAAAPAAGPAAGAPLDLIEGALAVAPAPAPAVPSPAVAPAPARDMDPVARSPKPKPPKPSSAEGAAAPDPAPASHDEPWVTRTVGDHPELLRGRVVAVRMIDGGAAELIVQAADAKAYRVTGGDLSGMSAERRAALPMLVGAPVYFRGDLPRDRTCPGGCEVSARSVSFPAARPPGGYRPPVQLASQEGGPALSPE